VKEWNDNPKGLLVEDNPADACLMWEMLAKG
jgi:hypothetical protein